MIYAEAAYSETVKKRIFADKSFNFFVMSLDKNWRINKHFLSNGHTH